MPIILLFSIMFVPQKEEQQRRGDTREADHLFVWLVCLWKLKERSSKEKSR